MRAIITGGSGLIGRELASGLLRDGYEVFVLSRRPGQLRGQPSGVTLRSWNGRSGSGWAELIDRSTAIVNLAGESLARGRWTQARKIAIRESRLHAGQAVSEAVRAAAEPPRVVIQASAVGYYGSRGSESVQESDRPGSDFLAQVCVAWEESTAGVESLGVRRAVIRTGVVLSLRDGALPRLIRPFRLGIGGPLGSGHQGFPWIHLADEVEAIRFVIDRDDTSGAFNLAAPQPVSNAQFSAALGKALARPALIRTPAFALRLAFGEMATVLLDGQMAEPARLQELGFRFRFDKVEDALIDLLY